jgi:hypothetical protein
MRPHIHTNKPRKDSCKQTRGAHISNKNNEFPQEETEHQNTTALPIELPKTSKTYHINNKPKNNNCNTTKKGSPHKQQTPTGGNQQDNTTALPKGRPKQKRTTIPSTK